MGRRSVVIDSGLYIIIDRSAIRKGGSGVILLRPSITVGGIRKVWEEILECCSWGLKVCHRCLSFLSVMRKGTLSENDFLPYQPR